MATRARRASGREVAAGMRAVDALCHEYEIFFQETYHFSRVRVYAFVGSGVVPPTPALQSRRKLRLSPIAERALLSGKRRAPSSVFLRPIPMRRVRGRF